MDLGMGAMEQIFSSNHDKFKEILPIVTGVMAREVTENALEAANHTVRSAYIAKDGLNTAEKSIRNAQLLTFALNRMVEHTLWINRYANSLTSILNSLNELKIQAQKTSFAEAIKFGHEKKREKALRYDKNIAIMAQQINGQTAEIIMRMNAVTQELSDCTRELNTALAESERSYKLALQMKDKYSQLLEAAEQTSVNIDQILASTETVDVERRNPLTVIDAA